MNAPETADGTTVASVMTRRRFIAGTGASVAALAALEPGLLPAADAATAAKLDLGVIGCGNRGKWIADLFQKHGGYNLVAAADYFQDRVDDLGGTFQIPSAKRYTGLSGYRRLLEQKLDAVVIESPPWFHPEHAAHAIEAGKHVFLSKPVAVDVPGCHSIEETGKTGAAKKLCFLVDFQTRASKVYQDAVQHVRGGELGKLISVGAGYYCGPQWEEAERLLRQNPTNPETRLRAWGLDRALSGDIITEQNIHALDVACWMLNAAPVKAYGTGGRAHEGPGNCWDHFELIFYFPDDITVTFSSNQAGFGYDDIACRVQGLKGTVDTHYYGRVSVKTKEVHSDSEVGNLSRDGVATNIAIFYDRITRSDFSNPTIAPAIRSTLTTILGRMAAYKNEVVTWSGMMRAKEKFTPDLKGLKT